MDVVNLAGVVPEYLDEKFFEKVIRQVENDPNATISSLKITPGTKPGENFASAVFRGTIVFKSKYTKEEKTISVIFKTKPILGPELAHWTEILEKSPFFPNEMALYGSILPEIQSLFSLTGDKDILSPKLIYQCNDPTPIIILEDVCVDGYTVIDCPPEDFEVSRKIVQRLAKFHAANFYLISENKFDPFKFNHCVFENPVAAQMLLGKSIAEFTEVIKEWDGYEKYVEHFETYKKNYLSKVLKTYAPNRNEFGFNVLNHADFHIRNLMVKMNGDDSIEDFLFLDYQICNYASPAIDLMYALYYMLSTENRLTRRNEFINSYYTQFATSLKQFGYMKTPPSLTDLQVELLKNGNLEVVHSICSAVRFAKLQNFEQGEDPKKFYTRLFNSPEYKSMIQKELPRFLHNGFI